MQVMEKMPRCPCAKACDGSTVTTKEGAGSRGRGRPFSARSVTQGPGKPEGAERLCWGSGELRGLT